MSNRFDGLAVGPDGVRAGNRTGTDAASGIAARLSRFLHCSRGVAAVEFGLAAPMLFAVLVPVADLGIAFSTQQQLRQAVQAGTMYAARHPWDQDAPVAITGAVTAAAPLSGVTVSPTPYQICGCPTGGADPTGSILTVACGSTCTGGETAGYYVVVSAQLPYTPILPYSLLGTSTVLTAQSMVRIR